MKILILSIIMFSLFFFLGVGIILFPRIQEVKNIQTQTFVPRVTSYSPPIPPDSLVATLINIKGNVKREERGSEEKIEATEGAKILPGEKITAGVNSPVTIQLTDAASITLDEESELDLVNLLPQTILFEQPMGTVTYNVTNQTVSVRSLNTLIALEQGETTITVKPVVEQIIIAVKKGKTTVGFNDPDYNTVIKNVGEGERGIIDTKARTISIRQFQISN